MAGVKGKSGRKPLDKEIAYVLAVQRGAPPSKVKRAVASVLDKAISDGNPKALTAVLQYIVPALTRSESGGIGDTQKYIDEVRNALGLGAGVTPVELAEDQLQAEPDTTEDLPTPSAHATD